LDEGGANGSGKSSISSKGIVWCLFGTTTGGIRAGNVVNRHGGKSAIGEVEFADSSGNKWLVRRQRPQKLELFKNGEDVSSKSTTETQGAINSAIGMDLATFVQTCHFGQGRQQSYAGLTAKDQKALLEQILPMEEIDAWAQYAAAQAKVLKDKKQTAHTEEVRCHGVVTERQEQLRTLKLSYEAFDIEKQKRIADLRYMKDVAEQKLNEKQKRLDWMREQVGKIDMDTLSAEQLVLDDSSERAEQVKALTHLKLQEASNSKSQWDKEEYDLQREIDKLKGSLICPTCNRDYGPQQKTIVNDAVTLLERARAGAIDKLAEANSALNYHFDQHEEASRSKERIENEFAAVTRKLEEVVHNGQVIERLEREISDEVLPINIRIDEAEKEVNPYINYAESQEAGLEEAIEAWSGAQEALSRINAEITHVQYWERVYSKELKLKMFEECCGFLDSATARHLKGLRNEQFLVKFSTIKRLANGETKDEFAVTVESVTGGGNFESLSGGEQQMVSLAIGLALADLASCKAAAKPEFMILDEPFSELDERNSEAIVDYLTGDFGSDKDTLLLISNEASLQGLIPERIHVIKQGGITNCERIH
jgi:DNA repair exonuclease SbcCD ATPase subunit